MSEKKERCAYQGEPGAYSEGCAADVFAAAGRPCEFVGLGSFDEVFASLAATWTMRPCPLRTRLAARSM